MDRAVRSVVFDLDGLLVDTEPIFRESCRRFLRQRGLEPSEALMAAMMGAPARDALTLLRDHYRLEDDIPDLAAANSRLFYEVLGQENAPLMPGALALLEQLESRGVPRAIATSSSRRYVNFILAPHALVPRFDFVLTCDDITRGKPDPEIYRKAADRFGHRPEKMVVLEDSPNGLRAAKAAGARCVIVPHALVPLHDLAGADAIVPSLAAPELHRLLGLEPLDRCW